MEQKQLLLSSLFVTETEEQDEEQTGKSKADRFDAVDALITNIKQNEISDDDYYVSRKRARYM